ncbi:hypothetical protein ACQ4PT_014539 [Festuca glaucescens]
MVKNKRRLKGGGKNRPYKRVRRPGLDGTSVVRLGSSSESSPDGLSELSEQVASRLRSSVVSLASFHGETMLLQCTGICIESSCTNATSFLTSSSNLIPPTCPEKDSLTIKVRLPNDQTVIGWLEFNKTCNDFAVVNIENVHGFHGTTHLNLDHEMQFKPYRKVVAIWRCFRSGLLMAKTRVDLASPSARIYQTMLSTCQIDKAGIGGPLLDFNGNFVGMNCSRTERKKTAYLQRDLILQCLVNYGIVKVRVEEGVDGVRERIRREMQELCAPCYFYPRGGGRRMINCLEAEFDGDIWSELDKDIASKMSRSVVSLASFAGPAKFFACTGVFIKCNSCSATILTSASLVRVSGEALMINDKLRIEVCLPNKFRVVGILSCYNLNYNVALVDIMGYWSPRVIEICQQMPVTSCMNVISVGCLFEHRKLMAAKGEVLIGKQSELDCQELCISTCKITKAGIGGPLIDITGNFVGINFNHEEETPFLPIDVIQRLLDFDKGWTTAADTCAEGGENRRLLPGPCPNGGTAKYTDTVVEGCENRWPLPKPRVLGATLAELGLELINRSHGSDVED